MKIKIIKQISLFSIVALLASHCMGLSLPFPQYEPGHLFSSHEIKNFSLSAPLSTLFRARLLNVMAARKVAVKGTLSYQEHGRAIKIPVELKLKPTTSMASCKFPSVEIKFTGSNQRTVFEGTKFIDLNTHCAEALDVSVALFHRIAFFNHREALIYQMMETLEMPTLHARAAFLQYEDTDTNRDVSFNPRLMYQAFFLEDMAEFRKRNRVTEVKAESDFLRASVEQDERDREALFTFRAVSETPQIETEDLARTVVFEFLVGNQDWFIRKTPPDTFIVNRKTANSLVNMKMFERPDGRQILIPSGFTVATFATGEDELPPLNRAAFELATESERKKVLQLFLRKRTEILNLVVLKNDEMIEIMRKTINSAFDQLEKELQKLK